ncbi:phosphoglycerate dehydrogenase [Peptostreptococcus anaerobius]|uniref:phosphoglycerate dehydrogenase n=1 Tax=Peptostreptococcus anaerobius TaxID=1261 RepID=UPI003D6F78EA
MKVILNRDLGQKKIDMIRDLGYDVELILEKDLKSRDDYYDADVWFTYQGFSKVDMDRWTNLKYIHTTSRGIDQVPKDFVVDRGCYLSCNTTGYSVPMAESIIMYILEVFKNTRTMFDKQDKRLWKMDSNWIELAGKRVGFLGTGNISYQTAKRLRAFDVEIWGVNTNGRSVEGFDRTFSLGESDEFFKECDVIIGLMPATEKTSGIIDGSKFELMKKGTTFLNIGRGNLVNHQDLVKYGPKFRGIVIDVADCEPLPADSPLWDLDNIIVSPHNSWVSENNIERLGDIVYENLKSFIETGRPKTWVKDINRGY